MKEVEMFVTIACNKEIKRVMKRKNKSKKLHLFFCHQVASMENVTEKKKKTTDIYFYFPLTF